ncbi:hypothetical protein DYST_00688 [Dyella terrae]|nr:hypothetical protein DYST_00688 [Dyella terrae]
MTPCSRNSSDKSGRFNGFSIEVRSPSRQTRFCYPVLTGQGIAMRQVDVVLSVLTLVAVGMGFAAYRAWYPDRDIREPAADSRPAVPPSLGPLAPVLARVRAQQAEQQAGQRAYAEYRACQAAHSACWWTYCKDGVLWVHATGFPDAQMGGARPGEFARCDIHLATPSEARKVSSAGPSDR